MNRIETWDELFIRMCQLVARKSKDPSNQFGAVIVGPDHEVRSTGFNGFPRGVIERPGDGRCHEPYLSGLASGFPQDSEVAARWERPEKYYFAEHAERNAIYNAARMGTPTRGCVIFVSGFPCHDCARAIIQAGIARLVYMEGGEDYNQRWADSIARSRVMFAESGVEVQCCKVPQTAELIDLTRDKLVDELMGELALCLTTIRDLRMGYPWKDLAEPFDVFYPRIRERLRSLGVDDEGQWDVA